MRLRTAYPATIRSTTNDKTDEGGQLVSLRSRDRRLSLRESRLRGSFFAGIVLLLSALGTAQETPRPV